MPVNLDESALGVLLVLPQPVWVFNLDTHRIVWSNIASQNLLGISQAQLLQTNIADLRPEEEREALSDTVTDFKNRNTLVSEWTINTGSNKSIKAQFHWQHCIFHSSRGVLATITDLTENFQQRLHEQTLQQENRLLKATSQLAEEEFKGLFESIPGKFMVLRPFTYEIVTASDNYIAAAMTERDQLIGQQLFTIFPDNPQNPTANGVMALRASLRRVENLGTTDVMGIQRYAIRGPNNEFEERHWSVINAPVKTKTQQLAYIIHRVEDVSSLLQNKSNGGSKPIDPTGNLLQEVFARFSEVRTALSKMQEQEILLRSAESMLNILAWEVDLQTGKIQWHVSSQDKSPGFKTVLKTTSLDEYLKQIHTEDRAEVLRIFNDQKIDFGHRFTFQHRVLGQNGTINQLKGTGEKHNKLGRSTIVGLLQDVTESVKTQEHLGRAQKLIEIAGNKAKLGGWSLRLDSARITWTSQTALIHEAPFDLAPTLEEAFSYYLPEYRQRIQNCHAMCINEGKSYDEILQIRTRQGRVLWVRAIGEPERDSNGVIVGAQGSFQDINELILEKKRNSDLEQKLLSTLENMSDAFFILSSDFDFLYLNLRTESLLKRDRNDLLGKNIWEEFPEAKDTPVYELYNHALDRKESFSVKLHYPPLNTWFEINGYPVSEGLAVYFKDITNEHKQEEAERLLQERFLLVSKATNDVIWDWDLQTQTVWWNESMSRVFGFDIDQLEPGPESWTNRIHPDDFQRVSDSIHQVIDGTDTHWYEEYRFLKADGKYAVVSDRGFIIRNNKGKSVRMLGSMLDLTDQKELEARLRESQRLEAMGQLTGGVAHDFNNLLTVIMGNAEVLSYRLSGDQQLRMLADMTAKAAERGAELTSRLLSFARRQPLQPLTIDVNRLIRDSQELFRRTLSESIEIEIVEGGGVWPIDVDPGQLEVALLNLVINARDAMQTGGKLTIETGNAYLDSDYAANHEELSPGQYIKLTVSDTGCGMSPATIKRAFEPFFTTKEVGKGSGLGLSMVFGFVKQSRGHIKIYSEINLGTAVKLYFPRSETNHFEATSPKASGKLIGGSEHILIVEDDELVREHLKGQLTELGYQVTVAVDGPSALEVLKQISSIDLLLTDIVMPNGINGRQLADMAKVLRPQLKILYTSGYTENAIVHHGRLDVNLELLSKPYHRGELARKLRKVLE